MKDKNFQNPTPTNKPPEGSKNDGGGKKEPTLRQALHILSFTHQETTGPPEKEASPI